MKHCVAILNKNAIFFFLTKTENRKAKQVLSGEWEPAGGGKMWEEGIRQ
jgi:hypothetical protein